MLYQLAFASIIDFLNASHAFASIFGVNSGNYMKLLFRVFNLKSLLCAVASVIGSLLE